ncbi:PH domain-like [Phytophthora cactorum]|nr:PH domain-like [Phytophthora cactorum]
MTYWKRHFFVFLTSGDLLYFRDDTLSELQGRVDVRHAPTVRVTGEQLMEERKKDGGMFKFGKMPALERETCLIWIATPPSKMFVLKLVDDHDESGGGAGGKVALGSSGVGVTTRKAELTPSSKKWLHLLLQGHAEQIRAGIPDELRGQLWKGFSGATDLQRRVELKHAIRSASKSSNVFRMPSRDNSVRSGHKSPTSKKHAIYEMCSAAIDATKMDTPENQMLFTRLCALALQESGHVAVSARPSELHNLSGRFGRAVSDASNPSDQYSEDRGSFYDDERDSMDDDDADQFEVEETKTGNDLFIGIALLFRAEETLFHAKTATEAEEYLRASERSCIDADAVFSVVFKDDLTIPWLTDEQLEKLRLTQRHRVMEQVSQKVGYFKDKLSILKLTQDLGSRCQTVAKQFLSDRKGVTAALRLSEAAQTKDERDPFDMYGLDEINDLGIGFDGDKLEDSFQMTLHLLLEQVRESSAAAEALAPPTPDSHSWLSQVKQGKISGAGHDASSLFSSNGDGFPSASRTVEASGMMFDTGETRLPSNEASESGNDNSIAGQRSCLLMEREDFGLSDRNLAEMFLYALVSSLKALCAVRLECLGVTYRFMWHGGSWLESAVEYPSFSSIAETDTAPSTPNSRQSVRVKSQSSMSSSSKRRPRAMDDSALSGRKRGDSGATTPKRGGARPRFATGGVGTNLYDDPIIEGQPAPSSPTYAEQLVDASDPYPITPTSLSPQDSNAVGLDFTLGRGLDRCAASTLDTSNKALLAALTAQHQDGERVFRESHKRLLSGLGKFLRLEYRDQDWALRERALTIERELQQELQEIEAEVHGAQWLQH